MGSEGGAANSVTGTSGHSARCQRGAARRQSDRTDHVGRLRLAGKRVELLRDIKPSLLRLTMLAQPDNTTARAYLQDTETVSRVLGINARTFEARIQDGYPALSPPWLSGTSPAR